MKTLKSYEYLKAEVNRKFEIVAIHERNFPFGPSKLSEANRLIRFDRRTWEDGSVEEFHPVKSYKEAGLFDEFRGREKEIFELLSGNYQVSEARDKLLGKTLRVGGKDVDGRTFYANAYPNIQLDKQFPDASIVHPLGSKN